MSDEGLTGEAERLIAEKPDSWEYLLTVEMLRSGMSPVLRRWDALKRGLYSKPTTRIPRDGSIEWMQDRLREVGRITGTFTALANVEFDRAWGAPGEPGDADAIVTTSQLWAEMCTNALAWEEAVRFASVDSLFEPVRLLYVGVAGRFIEETKKLPDFIDGTVNDPDASGTHTLDMVLSLPEEWGEQVQEAMAEVAAAYSAKSD